MEVMLLLMVMAAVGRFGSQHAGELADVFLPRVAVVAMVPAAGILQVLRRAIRLPEMRGQELVSGSTCMSRTCARKSRGLGAFAPHISCGVWVSAQEVQAFGPAAMYSAQTSVRTVNTGWNLRGTLAAGQTPSDNRAAYP